MALGPSDGPVAKYGPWALVIGAFLLAGYGLGDFIITALSNWVKIGFLTLAVIVVIFFMPVAVRWLRYMAWGADVATIKANAGTQLEMGLEAHSKMITELEGRVAEAGGYYNELKDQVRINKGILSEDDIKEFEDQLKDLKKATDDLTAMRDDEVRNHARFEMAVKAAQVKSRLGKGFARVTTALQFDSKTGQGARDNQIAFDSINRELAMGLGRMQAALNRPRPVKLTEVKEAPPVPQLPKRSEGAR